MDYFQGYNYYSSYSVASLSLRSDAQFLQTGVVQNLCEVYLAKYVWISFLAYIVCFIFLSNYFPNLTTIVCQF